MWYSDMVVVKIIDIYNNSLASKVVIHFLGRSSVVLKPIVFIILLPYLNELLLGVHWEIPTVWFLTGCNPVCTQGDFLQPAHLRNGLLQLQIPMADFSWCIALWFMKLAVYWMVFLLWCWCVSDLWPGHTCVVSSCR